MLLFELIKDIVRPITEYSAQKDYYNWKIKYRKNLLQFKEYHDGEDCYIIGNGPSLNKMDLSLLNGYHLFALNKAHFLLEQYKLNFSYHVCVDDEILEQILPVIETGELGCSSFISQRDLRKPLQDYTHVQRLYTTERWSFYTDISFPISVGYTVTFVALQLAYFMGFKRVFLIGVDHNWGVTNEPNSVFIFEGEDINHFHPQYSTGLHWHSPDKEGNEVSYALAKHHYNRNNRQIFDATVDGKLSVFPKIDFHSSLELANTKRKDPLLHLP
jgi:hypothetical protein